MEGHLSLAELHPWKYFQTHLADLGRLTAGYSHLRLVALVSTAAVANRLLYKRLVPILYLQQCCGEQNGTVSVLLSGPIICGGG